MTNARTIYDWQDDALCATVATDMFFPERGGSTDAAKAICARCPVTADCLAYALTTGQRDGIWGGLSWNERRRIRRAA